MADKEIHVVFRVLNFLRDLESNKYKLLPIDKLILIILASHSGARGIFPKQETLASELETSLRYMKSRLKHLERIGLLFVENINRINHYYFPFLFTIGDPQITYIKNEGDLRITPQVIHRSPHRGSTDATNNKLNNKLNKSERAQRSRSALSPSWKPNEKNMKIAQEVASKVGKTADQLITKFRNLQLSKDATSAYWDGEFENYLINERVPVMLNNGHAVREQPRPQLPNWTLERQLAEEAEAKKAQEEKPKELSDVVEYVPYKEMVRRHKLKQQGALTNGKESFSTGVDHKRGNSSH